MVEAGIEDVCLIEKGGDVGGTWYWNRYPGAQCDTAAMVYLPLLEETGHMPSEKYTHGPEILEHSRRIAKHYGLYDGALLSTGVTGLRWDGRPVPLARHDRPGRPAPRSVRHPGDRSHSTGRSCPASRASRPSPATRSTPAGGTTTITGGDPEGDAARPARRQAGGDHRNRRRPPSSACPHLASSCGTLYVCQRTPSSIDVRANHPIDPDWFADLEPGWQQRWLENFTILQTGGPGGRGPGDGRLDRPGSADPGSGPRRPRPGLQPRAPAQGVSRQRRRGRWSRSEPGWTSWSSTRTRRLR